MAPAYADLAAALADRSDVAIASVDCTQHKAVCDKADVKGFPTLKVFQGGQERTGYKGARTLDDMKAFVEEQHKLLMEETTA